MKVAVAGGTGTVGRHVVEIAAERGHDVAALSRSTGVDLVSGTGLDGALEGVEAVIDVVSVNAPSARASRRFFGVTTAHLLGAEQAAGVAQHLALSIVGAAAAPYGYFAGKALQEELVGRGRVPWTVLRATQFYEFAGQLLASARLGPFAAVPAMRCRPVAARDVAERLVDLAEAGPAGRVRDLAGPQEERMADLARRWAAARGMTVRVVEVPFPGRWGAALRHGIVLPGPDADLTTTTFEQWLAV